METWFHVWIEHTDSPHEAVKHRFSYFLAEGKGEQENASILWNRIPSSFDILMIRGGITTLNIA